MRSLQVVVGAKGRVVVPAPLRRALGLDEGSVLLARAEGDRLVLEPRSAAIRRLQERAAAVPSSVSLVEELIAERRREARREART
jgi:AbrB family looped-hinge helix DNA binding protein